MSLPKLAHETSTKLATFRGASWTSIASLAQAVTNIVAMAVLARLLLPEDFGIMSAFLLVANVGTIATHWGAPTVLVREQAISAETTNTTTTFLLLLSALGSLIVVSLRHSIAQWLNSPELSHALLLIPLIFILRALGVVPQVMLQRSMSFRSIAIIELSSFLVGYVIIAISLAIASQSYWSLVIGFASQAGLRTLLLFRVSGSRLTLATSRTSISRILADGRVYATGQIAHQLGQQTDTLIVATTMGAGPLGLYSRAHQLLAMPARLFSQTADKVLFTAVATIRHDTRKLHVALLSALELTTVVFLPASISVILLSPEIVSILLGDGWEQSIPLFRTLALGIWLQLLGLTSLAFVKAADSPRSLAYIQIVYPGIMATATLLGSFWGLQGITAGVLSAIFLNSALLLTTAMRAAATPFTSLIGMGLRWATIAAVFCLPLVIICTGQGMLPPTLARISSVLFGYLLILGVLLLTPKLILSPRSSELFERQFRSLRFFRPR